MISGPFTPASTLVIKVPVSGHRGDGFAATVECLLGEGSHAYDLSRFMQTFREEPDVVVCVPFDEGCAEHYGLIRAELEREGTPIGPYDLMIAATARAHDMTLVTHNVDEFARVVGLRVEDWER